MYLYMYVQYIFMLYVYDILGALPSNRAVPLSGGRPPLPVNGSERYLYIHIYIYTYVCIHIYVYIYIYIYIYIDNIDLDKKLYYKRVSCILFLISILFLNIYMPPKPHLW
jgi:hypothetical protein